MRARPRTWLDAVLEECGSCALDSAVDRARVRNRIMFVMPEDLIAGAVEGELRSVLGPDVFGARQGAMALSRKIARRIIMALREGAMS